MKRLLIIFLLVTAFILGTIVACDQPQSGVSIPTGVTISIPSGI